MRLNLPHGETDERKRYTSADPDRCSEAVGVLHYWLHNGGASPTFEQFEQVLALAKSHIHITTHELGEKHGIKKLRDIWRARRALGRTT